MKTKIIISLLVFLALWGCKGSMGISSWPFSSVEFSSQQLGKTIHLLDRKIVNVELDVQNKNYTVIRFNFIDRMQMGDKIHDIPWKLSVRLDESNFFKVLK